MSPTLAPRLTPLAQIESELARFRALDAEKFEVIGPGDLEIWTPMTVVTAVQQSASISVDP